MFETGQRRLEEIPLTRDARGAVRVGGTQVTLDMLMHAYDSGATLEEIVQKFGELDLDNVYAVITYYLRHPEEVRAYLEQRETEAAALHEKVKRLRPKSEFRERLLRLKQSRTDA